MEPEPSCSTTISGPSPSPSARGKMVTLPELAPAGMTRTPPGRSISMPAQRMMHLPTSPFSNSFVMQQQQNTLQAMSQSQGMNPNFYNNNNNNEGGGMMNQNNNPMMNNPNQMMNSQNPMMNNNQMK